MLFFTGFAPQFRCDPGWLAGWLAGSWGEVIGESGGETGASLSLKTRDANVSRGWSQQEYVRRESG